MTRHLALLALGLCMLAPCQAARLALLIGVSQVKAASPSPALEGVASDLAMARRMADRLGVADRDIALLADAGAGKPPTRANVQAAMQDLEKRTRPGDFVLLYLSGHSVQQPSIDTDRAEADSAEADRLDEIFLLADSQPWIPEAGILNALSDKEIHRWLQALDSKQVKVWLVADTCHAGGIARARLDWPDDEISVLGFRGLRPGWMGVKTWFRSNGKANPVESEASRMQKGALPHVAVFMAVDKSGSALEVKLRRDGRKVGLFTWALTQALTLTSAPINSGKLASETLEQYRRYPTWVVRPIFEEGEQSNSP